MNFSEQTEIVNIDLTHMNIEERIDPFANVGICFQIGSLFFIDLEYRHLLDNWGTANISTDNQLLNSDNGSVKLHMINLSAAILF